MAKTVVYRRHGNKNAANHISSQGLQDAINKGKTDPLVYDKVVAGKEPRTWETLLAYIIGNQSKPIVLEAHDEFGDQNWFNEMLKRGDGFAAEVKKAGSNAKAFDNILTAEEKLGLGQTLADGFKKLLDQVEDCESCLAIGHSPMVELTMVALGLITLDEAATLGELEGYVVVQHDDKITCERLS